MSNIFVVVLIGLPGAGKTTFCRNIFDTEHIIRRYNVIHVCFDNYIKVGKDSNSYTRKELINEIKNLIDSIKTHNVVTNLFLKASNSFESNDKYLILIDDNNYYKGMRYEFYRICKIEGTTFAQIYFSIPLHIVLKRNHTRKDGYIPETIIINMSKKLEVPSKQSNWEKCTVFVTHEDPIEMEDVISYIEKCPRVKTSTVKQSIPINQNKIHEIDIILRKHINHLITINKENKSKTVKIMAEKLNSKRKALLEDLRYGILNLDNDKLIDILKYQLQDNI